jgi:hypothetical protein
MLKRTDAIINEVLEPIMFVLAYPTLFTKKYRNNTAGYFSEFPYQEFQYTIVHFTNKYRISIQLLYNAKSPLALHVRMLVKLIKTKHVLSVLKLDLMSKFSVCNITPSDRQLSNV